MTAPQGALSPDKGENLYKIVPLGWLGSLVNIRGERPHWANEIGTGSWKSSSETEEGRHGRRVGQARGGDRNSRGRLERG